MTRRNIPSAALAALAALACGGPPSDSGAAGRCVEAFGGRETLESVMVVHTVDSLWLAGLAGTSESWWQRNPFRGRVTVQVGPVRQDLLIIGDSAWTIDRNGLLAPGDDMARMQGLLAREMIFMDAFLSPGGLEELPDSTVDGVPVSHLLLSREGLEDVHFYISRETWLPILIRTTVMGMEVLSRPADYRDVGGVVSPASTREVITALGQESVSRSILVEYNVPVPDSVFAAAGQSGDWELAAPGVPFPFELHGGHIYLPGRVAGREVDFLLDSGAGATVLDSRLAGELGLAGEGDFSALGIGGASSFGFVRVPEYSAAGATVRSQTLAVMALDEPFYPSTGRHIGLVLGYDFLSRFVTKIDYGACTLTLYDPADWACEGRGDVLEAGRAMGLLSIEAVLEDSIPVKLLLDTGAGGGLHFSPSFLEAHPGLLEGRPSFEASVQGVGGEESVTFFRAGPLRMGSFVVESGLCSSAASAPVLASFDGIVGSDVLARFVLTLDYSRSEVILEPSTLFGEGLPEQKTGMGAGIEGDALEVTEVMPGSPAERAGLKPGDRLLNAAGIPLGADGLAVLDSLSSLEEGFVLDVAFERAGAVDTARIVLERLLSGGS
ncbi:PDZ domain-containing protein [Candidatus Fermentibacteria bacterium]|nr:PDZ domain-containing protein [Candidatus Fermentibacteria bacterium]